MFPSGFASIPLIPEFLFSLQTLPDLTHRTVPQIPHGTGILQQLTKHAWWRFFSSFQHTNSLIASGWGMEWYDGGSCTELQLNKINHSCKLLSYMFDLFLCPLNQSPLSWWTSVSHKHSEYLCLSQNPNLIEYPFLFLLCWPELSLRRGEGWERKGEQRLFLNYYSKIP